MKFIYTEDYSNYGDILNKKVKLSLCKHVMNLESDKSKRVYQESLDIGYSYVMWGYGTEIEDDYKLNRKNQLGIIYKMIQDHLDNAVRIIIDTDGDIWIDNLHSTIRNIILMDENITIGDMKCYIVDFHSDVSAPVIIDVNGSLSNNINDIKNMLNVSFDRLNRISNGIKKANYTIGEFILENKLNKDEYINRLIKRHKEEKNEGL